MKKIGFWKVDTPYGEFSNWWLCGFIYKEHYFISSEQALMWEKAEIFNDKKVAAQILKTTNQKEIKKLGRQVENYNEAIWSAQRESVMVDILMAKFSQNKDLKEILLETGDAELYEASPLDRIWGIGSADVENIRGQNLLGKALMKTRAILLDQDKQEKDN